MVVTLALPGSGGAWSMPSPEEREGWTRPKAIDVVGAGKAITNSAISDNICVRALCFERSVNLKIARILAAIWRRDLPPR